MERRKRYQVRHSKNERIGILTGLLDCECFGVFFGLWYLDRNPYNADCYGKFVDIPNDQGMRMELLPISKDEITYDKENLK